jgi:chromosome segregation ATPase
LAGVTTAEWSEANTRIALLTKELDLVLAEQAQTVRLAQQLASAEGALAQATHAQANLQRKVDAKVQLQSEARELMADLAAQNEALEAGRHACIAAGRAAELAWQGRLDAAHVGTTLVRDLLTLFAAHHAQSAPAARELQALVAAALDGTSGQAVTVDAVMSDTRWPAAKVLARNVLAAASAREMALEAALVGEHDNNATLATNMAALEADCTALRRQVMAANDQLASATQERTSLERKLAGVEARAAEQADAVRALRSSHAQLVNQAVTAEVYQSGS